MWCPSAFRNRSSTTLYTVLLGPIKSSNYRERSEGGQSNGANVLATRNFRSRRRRRKNEGAERNDSIQREVLPNLASPECLSKQALRAPPSSHLCLWAATSASLRAPTYSTPIRVYRYVFFPPRSSRRATRNAWWKWSPPWHRLCRTPRSSDRAGRSPHPSRPDRPWSHWSRLCSR